jgi:hypothetical protein
MRAIGDWPRRLSSPPLSEAPSNSAGSTRRLLAAVGPSSSSALQMPVKTVAPVNSFFSMPCALFAFFFKERKNVTRLFSACCGLLAFALLRSFANVQVSTPVFSCAHALFVKNTREGGTPLTAQFYPLPNKSLRSHSFRSWQRVTQRACTNAPGGTL